jgi:single-strand DNA-binding protein
MEVTGTLKAKFDTQKVSDRFQKREFVLTTEANTPYPQHVSFQVTQDKCSTLDQYNVGDELKIQFNLRGREWNGPQGIKYFNTLEAWRIERFNNASNPAVQQNTAKTTNTQGGGFENNSSPVFSAGDDNEDLPF